MSAHELSCFCYSLSCPFCDVCFSFFLPLICNTFSAAFLLLLLSSCKYFRVLPKTTAVKLSRLTLYSFLLCFLLLLRQEASTVPHLSFLLYRCLAVFAHCDEKKKAHTAVYCSLLVLVSVTCGLCSAARIYHARRVICSKVPKEERVVPSPSPGLLIQ
jgi:hypothetical protein